MPRLGAVGVDWDSILPLQRSRLVRYCARLTGDPDVAEDLTQETMYEAWRHFHKLYEPEGLDRWLAAIARNVCARWARQQGRALHNNAQTNAADDPSLPLVDLVVDDFDVEVELERGELVELLDRALALLPAETRQVLVQRYVHELPQAEIAQRLGCREGAIEGRVQRGKLALRRILSTTLVREASAYNLVNVMTAVRQQTRMWCPGCGLHHLEGYLRPEEGELYLRCPRCSISGITHCINAHMGNALHDVRTYKPAVSRVLSSIYNLFQVHAVAGGVRCLSCDIWMPICRERSSDSSIPIDYQESISVCCTRCGMGIGRRGTRSRGACPKHAVSGVRTPACAFFPDETSRSMEVRPWSPVLRV